MVRNALDWRVPVKTKSTEHAWQKGKWRYSDQKESDCIFKGAANLGCNTGARMADTDPLPPLMPGNKVVSAEKARWLLLMMKPEDH